MITVRLGEEFREPIEKIKKYFPGTSNSQIVTNIINSYLPIYEEGIESLQKFKQSPRDSSVGCSVGG